MKKLVCGVGINDADYVTQPKINGKQVCCKFYSVWLHMLRRCYSENYQNKKPTYKGCSVCEEWLTFSNFKAWMEKQDWQGHDIDKDILVKGNKVYSPETCVFVTALVNTFIISNDSSKGEHPIGVTWHKRDMKFRALCSNPFSKKQECIGYFDDAHNAHLAWKKRKHELACQLADIQDNPRVAEALRTRYA